VDSKLQRLTHMETLQNLGQDQTTNDIHTPKTNYISKKQVCFFTSNR